LSLLLAGPWLLAPPPAAADTAPVCQGRDLSHDPDIKPDFAAHADDLLNGDGLLWKIDKPGLAPSFLFGTVHSTTPAAVALASEAATHIDGAKSVATELGPIDAVKKVEMSLALLKAANSPEDDTFAGEIAESDVPTVDAYLASRGFPKEMAHHLKLWFLVIAASVPACEAEGQRRGMKEVDEMIAETGAEHHVPVVALETLDEQMQALASTPAPLAATVLAATARAPNLEDDSYATLLSLYLQKRPSAAIAILDALPDMTAKERAAEAEITRLLLVGRNETMMRRAAPLLAAGGAFIAVGALHLPGKDGLIARARAAGYQVTKVW
jgi:uncharacterized protein YbaP (TraB family)